MKCLALSLFLSVLLVGAHAQSVERSVISSAGATQSSGGIRLSSTVGQIANAVKPAASLLLEEGFQPVTGYERWTSGFPGLGGPGDDPDNDGRCNVVEYALGSDPFAKDADPVIDVAVSPGNPPRLTVSKGDVAGKDAQVVYRIEMSTSLAAGSWSVVGLVTQTDSQSLLVVTPGGFPAQAFFILTVSVDTVKP